MSKDDTSIVLPLILNEDESGIFNLIDKEIERCLNLTNGCGFAMIIEALKVNKNPPPKEAQKILPIKVEYSFLIKYYI